MDIVGVLSESDNPRNYWKVLKYRLKKEGNESVTNCNQLKLKASDDKYYNTDVCDIEEMFRIIESIPSKNALSKKDISFRNTHCHVCKPDNITFQKGEGKLIIGDDIIALVCHDCKKVYGFSAVKYNDENIFKKLQSLIKVLEK